MVDSVEIVRGATTLQRFDVGAAFTPGSMGAALGRAMALPALVSECANETTRLSAYGIIVRGRNEMGPFEARCGTAESGSRWPPGTHLACHRNVDRPPMTLASTRARLMLAASPPDCTMVAMTGVDAAAVESSLAAVHEELSIQTTTWYDDGPPTTRTS